MLGRSRHDQGQVTSWTLGIGGRGLLRCGRVVGTAVPVWRTSTAHAVLWMTIPADRVMIKAR